MEKEKILEAAQRNKSANEYENNVESRAITLGCAISLIVAVLMYYAEFIFRDRTNWGLLAVGFTAGAVQDLYKGLKNKQRSSLIIGIVFALISLASIVLFICQLV